MHDNKAVFLNPIITAHVGWIEIYAQALHRMFQSYKVENVIQHKP